MFAVSFMMSFTSFMYVIHVVASSARRWRRQVRITLLAARKVRAMGSCGVRISSPAYHHPYSITQISPLGYTDPNSHV